MKKGLSLLFLSLSPLLLTQCDSPVPFASGRYRGLQAFSNGDVRPVIAQVSLPKEMKRGETYRFDLFEALASAKAQSIFLRAERDDVLRVQLPFLEPQDYRLSIQNSCAQGEADRKNLRLCFGNGKVDLDITDSQTGLSEYSLHLVREDSLPERAPEESKFYGLDDLMGRAKFFNYTVAQDAERVYRSKEKIGQALGNLLPHFNMRDLLSYASSGPMGLVGSVGNLLPFLFPSNWFQWKESKLLYQADVKAFASLRGNQMSAVENLYYLIHRDQELLRRMDLHLDWLNKIEKVIKAKEQLGALAQGSTDRFNMHLASFLLAREEMRVLVNSELSELARAVALSPRGGIDRLGLVTFPNFSEVQENDSQTLLDQASLMLFEQAKEKSLELATLDFLIEASRAAKNQVAYGFLDPNSTQSFGFGYAPSIKIAKSSTRELQKRKEETLSLLQQRSYEISLQTQSAIHAFRLSESGLKSSRSELNRMLRMIATGEVKSDDQNFIKNLDDAFDSVLKFEANRDSAAYLYLIATSKRNRLLLQGFYSELEVALPQPH